MISTIIAYILVVALGQFCLTGGVWLIGFPVALLLAWAPMSFRTTVAGIIGGISGVALAVVFGYGLFRLLVGPDSFTLGPFFASTVPLLLPIWNDWVQSKRVKSARQQLLDTLRDTGDINTVNAMATETQTAHGSGVVGEIAGLVLAAVWFFRDGLMQSASDTSFILVEAIFGIVWLLCVVICVLKGKIWSAIIGVVSAVAMAAGWTIAGWYIFNPFVWVPVFAAMRLAPPDSYWAYWFYRNHPKKYTRAIVRYNMMKEYLELQRRAQNETKEKPE